MNSNIQKVASGFAAPTLLASLNTQAELWTEKTWRQDYSGSAHKDTETVFLRWSPEDTREAIQFKTEAVDTKNAGLLPILPLINKALKSVEATELGRVIIVSLKPGGEVTPHIDEGTYADKFERFHLCLQAENAEFFVEEESVEMKAGELWWFNHKRTHGARNEGSIPRIHIIIDAVAPKYRRERAN